MENTSTGKILDEVIKEIEQKRNQNGITGIATGFHDLDRLAGGLQKGEMIVVAGRPAMGKTAFGVSIAKNIATNYRVGVAIFALEMSAIQMASRVIGNELQIHISKLNRGEVLSDEEFTELIEGAPQLNHLPIFIDDTSNIDLIELCSKCWRYKNYQNVQCIIIDYLQLMTAYRNIRKEKEGEIAFILSNIKQLAKDLDMPIIVLSQLSRTVEQREDKRPLLYDFHDTIDIERIVDKLYLLYRPEYYGFTVYENKDLNREVTELITVDTRNGASTSILLRLRGKFSLFENLQDSE
ncbi:MAG: DnaB-like helicase C-terminal domain-containing protein [Pedobacter sp.]|uniref:DnaB-like helicase C-terminal domain-containing protein n=1 Tax=Pedobacter sp. TaxID=1411316 RepID=UPI0028079318|nr:DnaB-like helicase C-terminal domain-containing protein [Pedobacter sp.]MDQ8004815.1 DnaB-like helicase C-terminal domain-containing protein [Pedobacter sp.]